MPLSLRSENRSPLKRLLRVGLLPVFLLLTTGCEDNSGPTKPEEPEPPLYGALVTPVRSYGADPLLARAYQSLTGDRYDVAHAAVSWAEIATGRESRNWQPLDLHVRRAIVSQLKLSIVLEFLHGGEVEVPEYVEFMGWSWDEPQILWELARFLREFAMHAQGTVDYLWLGEGPDRYVTRYPEFRMAVSSFYAVLADSAKQIFPEAKLGILVSAPQLAETGQSDFVRALRDTLGMIALSVYPEELDPDHLEPSAALTLIRDSIEPWTDAPFAIVETGYSSEATPGNAGGSQSDFVTIFGKWLHQRPETLELLCWSPVHDAGSDLADRLAERRYPVNIEARERYAAILTTNSLRRLDGSRKPAREVFLEVRP